MTKLKIAARLMNELMHMQPKNLPGKEGQKIKGIINIITKQNTNVCNAANKFNDPVACFVLIAAVYYF